MEMKIILCCDDGHFGQWGERRRTRKNYSGVIYIHLYNFACELNKIMVRVYGLQAVECEFKY